MNSPNPAPTPATKGAPTTDGPSPLVKALVVAILLGCTAWIVYRMSQRLSTGVPYIDFQAFYFGARAIVEGQNPYLVEKKMYIYPPLLATVMAPLTFMDIIKASWVWLAISMVGSWAAMWLLVTASAERLRITLHPWLVPTVGAVCLLLFVDRFRWEYENGQTDWILVLGYAMALKWVDKCPWLAGIGLGMAANIKYTALIMLPYFIVRRRWSAALWTILGTGFWALAPALVLGWTRNLEYLTTAMAGIVKMLGINVQHEAANVTTATWERSVSIGSLAARLSEQAGWGVKGTIALTGIAGLAALAAAWLIYRAHGVPMWLNRGGAKEADPPLAAVTGAEFVGLVLAAVIFVPQMMGRHAFITLPVLVLGITMLLHPKPGVSNRWLIAGIAIGIAGLILPPGGAMFLDAVEAWRLASGTSWCLLLMFLCVLASALAWQRELAKEPPSLSANGALGR